MRVVQSHYHGNPLPVVKMIVKSIGIYLILLLKTTSVHELLYWRRGVFVDTTMNADSYAARTVERRLPRRQHLCKRRGVCLCPDWDVALDPSRQGHL